MAQLITNSLRLRSSVTAYLFRTFSTSPTTRTKGHFHFSFKPGALGVTRSIVQCYDGTSVSQSIIRLDATDHLYIDMGGSTAFNITTNMVFRDPSRAFVCDIAIDTTDATNTNRVKLWIDGVPVTSFSVANWPAQNSVHQFMFASANNRIGARYDGLGTEYLDGYLSDFYWIADTPKLPTDFLVLNPATNTYDPIAYAGGYGSNGFRLQFNDASAATAAAIGKDTSGNGLNWTPNAISVTAGSTYDSLVDTPTNGNPALDTGLGGQVPGNYCTFNPLVSPNSGTAKPSNGNLTLDASVSGFNESYGTQIFSYNYYCEMTVAAGALIILGVCYYGSSTAAGTGTHTGYRQDGQKYVNGAPSAYGSAYTTGDVIGMAVTATTVTFYKNNVSQGAITHNLIGDFFPFALAYYSGGASKLDINFGQRAFTYTAPSGFKALCTANFSDPAIKKPSTYFDILTYAGSGGVAQTLAGLNFQPDFSWFKCRGPTARNHAVFDSVRGANQGLYPSLTNAEGTWSGQAFTSNGFTVDRTFSGEDNSSGDTFVGWFAKKGALPGIDIVGYTGNGAARTIAHSLGVAPSFMLVKDRTTNNGNGFLVYHSSQGATKYLDLSSTAAVATLSSVWNNTAPTSSVFSVGTASGVNTNTDNYIAYLFAEVSGFSKFNIYTGTALADGPYVHCGFRPRWILWKEASGTNAATSAWCILDTARDPFNVAAAVLQPNGTGVESYNVSAFGIDFLSTGFKVRAPSNQNTNESGGAYIFAAFADVPAKYSAAPFVAAAAGSFNRRIRLPYLRRKIIKPDRQKLFA